MAESGRFSMFIDQPKTLSGEGRLEVYRALNRLRYVSNYYFFFLSLSLSPSTSQLNLAPPQPITHRKHFCHRHYDKNTIYHHSKIKRYSYRFRVAKTTQTEKENDQRKGNEGGNGFFLFKKLFGRPDNRWVCVLDGGGPVPSKSCGGCVLVKKGEEPSGTNRNLVNTPFSPYDQHKKGVSQLFFFTFCFFFFFPL